MPSSARAGERGSSRHEASSRSRTRCEGGLRMGAIIPTRAPLATAKPLALLAPGAEIDLCDRDALFRARALRCRVRDVGIVGQSHKVTRSEGLVASHSIGRARVL